MTAEFDSSGFSAVDKFFGNGTENATGHKKLTGSFTADIRGKRRGGVGVNDKNNNSGTKQLSSDLLAKQILSVGRKRSRDNSNEDSSGEYEGDGADDHGVHDADERDVGRTSIVEMKTTNSKKTNRKDKKIKPKKKLGKKERERQKHAVNDIEVSEADANHGHHQTSGVATTETPTNGKTSDVAKHSESTERTTKRKRRKVRSRQKNIRKDNRSVDEKPAHLIPGNRNYQGRPMTQATRERLNLPPHKKKRINNTFNENQDGNSSLFVIDRNPDSNGHDVGVNLAIDEYMKNVDKSDVDESASLNEKQDHQSTVKTKRKSSKKKNKLFKNLV